MLNHIDLYHFRDQFQAIRPDNFSYKGLGVLFEMIEQFEDETDSAIEFDVIGLCCEFSEYTLDELIEYYSIPVIEQIGSFDDWRIYGNRTMEKVEEYLLDNCGFFQFFEDDEGGISVIIQDF